MVSGPSRYSLLLLFNILFGLIRGLERIMTGPGRSSVFRQTRAGSGRFILTLYLVAPGRKLFLFACSLSSLTVHSLNLGSKVSYILLEAGNPTLEFGHH